MLSMLKGIDALLSGFQEIEKESMEQCGDKIEIIRRLILINRSFYKSLMEVEFKITSRLALLCLAELYRTSGHVLFFAVNGLYRNAFDNIRHTLESIVQAVYIDCRHLEAPLLTKIEILKEVEDKREYHAIRLIDELEIDYKDKLKQEYKRLSRIIHPSHKQVLTLVNELLTGKGIPTTVDCSEVSDIYDSMKMMFDIFFFLFINYYPKLQELLKKNSEFIGYVKRYNLYFLSKCLGINLS